jgi:hypothetical protein
MATLRWLSCSARLALCAYCCHAYGSQLTCQHAYRVDRDVRCVKLAPGESLQRIDDSLPAVVADRTAAELACTAMEKGATVRRESWCHQATNSSPERAAREDPPGH